MAPVKQVSVPFVEQRIELANDERELRRLAAFAHAFAESAQLDKQTAFALDLVLTEWLSNVLAYASPRHVSATIAVRLRADSKLLTIEVEDSGQPFNPLTVPAADIALPLERKPIGGLGIHIIRQYMDDLQYERSQGKNHLLMRKRIGTTPGSTSSAN